MTHFINGKLLSTSSIGAATDVQAAAQAYHCWHRATPGERSAVLARFACMERAEEFARLESRQAVKPIRLILEFDVPATIDNIDFFSGARPKPGGQGHRRVLRRPHLLDGGRSTVGVVRREREK